MEDTSGHSGSGLRGAATRVPPPPSPPIKDTKSYERDEQEGSSEKDFAAIPENTPERHRERSSTQPGHSPNRAQSSTATWRRDLKEGTAKEASASPLGNSSHQESTGTSSLTASAARDTRSRVAERLDSVERATNMASGKEAGDVAGAVDASIPQENHQSSFLNQQRQRDRPQEQAYPSERLSGSQAHREDTAALIEPSPQPLHKSPLGRGFISQAAAGSVVTPERPSQPAQQQVPYGTEHNDGQNISSTSILRDEADNEAVYTGERSRRIYVDPVSSGPPGPVFRSYSPSQQQALMAVSHLDSGRAASVGGSVGSSSAAAAAGYAEMRAMLVTAEKEVAAVREECARRGMRIDTLTASLERERATTQSLREHHADELEATRIEHESQTRQLREQLRVLKLVAEGAMADKNKVAEEAERRKRELLGLLDREREEKSHIMAEYREQTEALIAEQGREITALRSALTKVKEEYDRLSAEHQASEDELASLRQELGVVHGEKERERLEGLRAMKEVQSRLQTENADLQEQLAASRSDHAREASKLSNRAQELAEQLRKSQDKAQEQQAHAQQVLEEAKQAHRRDMDRAQRELEELQARAERQAEEYRRDVEKASRAEEKTSAMLREALDATRAEKDAAIAEAQQQKDTHQSQHRSKVAQLQATLDAVSAELTQERTVRKDTEAELELAGARADNSQRTIESLGAELEAAHADQRKRERTMEQAHQAALEDLRAKLRGAAADFAAAQQQHYQQTIEHQKLRDEIAMKATALGQAQSEQQRIGTQLAAELAKQQESASIRQEELGRNVQQLKEHKGQLEAERQRLERAVKDCEARLQGAAKQLEQERAALEETTKQLQDARAESDALREALAREKVAGAELVEALRSAERRLQEQEVTVQELQAAVSMAQRRAQEQLQDQSRQNKMYEGKLADEDQRHRAEAAALRMSIEQLRGDVARAKELAMTKEAALQQLREESAQRDRASALRETALQEELEDLRTEHEAEMRRMDEVLNGLRSDLHKTQAMCTEYQRELSSTHRSAEGRRSDLEIALEQSEAARAKLQDDAKYREQLNQELQGTVRLLTARLNANEDDVQRMQEELAEINKKIQDAHTLIGRKDAAIGQLNAKLRAYEARGGVL